MRFPSRTFAERAIWKVEPSARTDALPWELWEHRCTAPAPFPWPGLATFSFTGEAPPVGEHKRKVNSEPTGAIIFGGIFNILF